MENADWRGAKTIHASNLVALHKQLEGGSPEGARIKELLIKLGEETGCAAHVEGHTGSQLQQLAEALHQAGNSL